MRPADEENEEPDWVKTEREQFLSYRDKDSDGRMDRKEVQDWIIPPDYDHSEAEAKHLIFESDGNQVCTCRSYPITQYTVPSDDDARPVLILTPQFITPAC